MVRVLKKNRRAIAMLELIFAIVIIGITLASVPQLVSTAKESGFMALQQESVAQAASDISLLLTREWDEACTNPSFRSVIVSTNGDAGLAARNGARSRTLFTSTGESFNAPAVLVDEGDNDDVDDVATNKLTTIEATDIDAVDKNISIAVTVGYGSDTLTTGVWETSKNLSYNNPFTSANPATTTSIKRIAVTLTSNSGADELKKQIVLNAFSCNIGSYGLNRRELP